MPWLDDVDAVVQAWYTGQELGHSLAAVLSGDINPSGRLPVSFPLTLASIPCFSNFPGENERVEYTEGVFVGYRHYTSRNIPLLFPFGYGLSFTSFSIGNLALVGVENFGPSRSIEVSLTVTNTGRVPGRYTALVFVSPPSSFGPSRPVFSLEGFAKTKLLEPGQEETLSISLDGSAFSQWVGNEAGAWEVEPGSYGIEVRQDATSNPLASTAFEIMKGWTWRGVRA
ncbi:hypothetical protein JCM8547_002627 [Rhodosporidiobolus lusitaniae]